MSQLSYLLPNEPENWWITIQLSGKGIGGRKGPLAQQMWAGGALEGFVVIFTGIQNYAPKK